ncbi:uncharacterized protein LOC106752904 [Vigna radiata var. radiata]|uniref:Uncharacterized protein LOC106752903 n=1 Tax=Vigna radiata var. radiata TaxID=3916 RepID=A0A1S3T8T2_VIGRR|nr:uncharacterized protein LOC106752903 [Vigna radiata var. radiata]XP_014490177.2 uncharacterized protein LOC106752904 [Vigna radiata var. radiata]
MVFYILDGWEEEENDVWRRYVALKNMGWDWEAAYNINSKSVDLLEEERAAITVELCEMKKVHLQDLPNLRSFSLGDTLKWSSLDNVVLKDCPKVKKFGLGMIKESELKSILITENEEQIDPHTKLPYLFELSNFLTLETYKFYTSYVFPLSNIYFIGIQRRSFTNLRN